MDLGKAIRIEGDYVQSYQDELHDIQIDRLKHRMTFMSVAFLIIIGACVFGGYNYIKDLNTKMPQEVQVLSQHVVERMSSISERYSTMEQTMNSKFSLLEKVTEGLREDKKEIEKAIAKFNEDKMDKAEIEQTMGDVKNQLQTQLTNQVSQSNQKTNELMSSFSTDISKEMSNQNQTFNAHIESINKEIASLKQDIESSNQRIEKLSSSFDKVTKEVKSYKSNFQDVSDYLNDAINSETLENRLRIERETYQEKYAKQVAIMEKKVQVLENSVQKLERKIQELKKASAQSSTVINNKKAIKASNNTKAEKITPIVKKPLEDLKQKAANSPVIVNPKKVEIKEAKEAKEETKTIVESKTPPKKPLPTPTKPGDVFELELKE